MNDTDFMGQELSDGDFVCFSRYGSLKAGVVKNVYPNITNIIECGTQFHVDKIDKREHLSNYNIRTKSVIKLDVNNVHPEIQKFYRKIVKHTKGIE